MTNQSQPDAYPTAMPSKRGLAVLFVLAVGVNIWDQLTHTEQGAISEVQTSIQDQQKLLDTKTEPHKASPTFAPM